MEKDREVPISDDRTGPVPVTEILAAYLPVPEEPEPEPAPEPPTEEAPPKKKASKKRLILTATAIVTALVLIVGGVFLLLPDKKPVPLPGGFYLLTKASEYNADGTPGYSQRTYTYDDRGFPLSIETDQGSSAEQIWNDAEGIYETVFESFDGKPEVTVQYVYNERGDILYYLETRNKYDAEGDLISTTVEDNDRSQNHTYEYDLDGKIQSVISYAVPVGGGGTGKQYSALRHYYDEDGRPYELWLETFMGDSLSMWAFDYRYDAEGRLTAAATHLREGLAFYTYEYDENGRLTRVALMTNYYSAPLDDDCINELEWDITDYYEHTLLSEARFTYDSDGRLTSRGVYDDEGELLSETDCEYRDGQLSRVTYTAENGGTTTYRYADEGNGTDITLVRDENGNIVRQIRPDGSYIEYEYQRFDLSDEDIQRAKNVQYVLNGIDPMGDASHWYAEFEGSYAFMADIPYPTTVLYETDILRNQ